MSNSLKNKVAVANGGTSEIGEAAALARSARKRATHTIARHRTVRCERLYLAGQEQSNALHCTYRCF